MSGVLLEVFAKADEAVLARAEVVGGAAFGLDGFAGCVELVELGAGFCDVFRLREVF